MKVIVFFNNKGGVGKTSLVYHLAWMYADLGTKVIAADLDPQANLTSMFLPEERLEELWPETEHDNSVLGAISPILRGLGDIRDSNIEQLSENLGLIPGDLGLSRFEAKLSEAWPNCLNRDESAFRTISSFYRILHRSSERFGAKLVLIDVGPNLGAINRSAIISADHVVVPLVSDLFSLQGLKNLGPTLREWRGDWNDRLSRRPSDTNLLLPSGEMNPVGYIIMQHAIRADRPAKAYERWMNRIPSEFRTDVLRQPEEQIEPSSDPYCLSLLKHYRSLMPMAQDAQKPIFHLKAADGALGGHIYAVQECYEDFRNLAHKIADKCGIAL